MSTIVEKVIVTTTTTTPNNKRRRNDDLFQEFTTNRITKTLITSSTPIRKCQPLAFVQPKLSNQLPIPDACMEVKSIAAILADQKPAAENPYEVIRKPPKKKKKTNNEEHCFTNPALNLNTPEKTFNPYEVKRAPKCNLPDFEKRNHSFVNLALNLRAPEHVQLQNPYEIIRNDEKSHTQLTDDEKSLKGIENPALDMQSTSSSLQLPCPLTIAVPFTPTVNRRIKFHHITTPDNMTPSELLASKLCFTPEEINTTPKRSSIFAKSLSTISEETINIDEELDCYQLELENSINEAKMMNRKYFQNIRKDDCQLETKDNLVEMTNEECSSTVAATCKVLEIVNPDVEYEDEDDRNDGNESDEFEFKNPQPFQRAYRRSVRLAPKPSISHEMLPPPSSNNSSISSSSSSKSSDQHGLKNAIRRSIRRLTHRDKKDKDKKSEEKINDKLEEKIKHNENKQGHGIMASIRHSFRKKKPSSVVENIPQSAELHEMSIVGDFDRKVFKEETAQEINKDEAVVQNHDFLTRSNLRRSTRDFKRQILKNVFKKNVEGYELD